MKTWKLIIVGIGIHLVFFYSIFDIYFTSPIVHGMTPHSSSLPPLASRLVFFSADGLRADKMLELESNGDTRVPYLRDIIQNRGAWGVSHTRVPTESRPGHVALIAGFYEDVSAVAKGWKENPVEFDSVFNESHYTWSWGSPDILPMFAKGASGDHVFTSCYPAHFEDFASSDSTLLDSWVFDEVKKFFQQAEVDAELREKLHKDKVVFFLHLLGIDTNGHANKPYSRQYLENIRFIDKGIREMEELIDSYYGNDGKTAYVMSSDHGMTDWGSHGAGHPSETLTPIVAWGAGIRGPLPASHGTRYQDGFSAEWKLDHLEREDVQQADVASLMAALIGVNFPMNSVGRLPWKYLKMSDWEVAELMYANLQQILAQYERKPVWKFAPSCDQDHPSYYLSLMRIFRDGCVDGLGSIGSFWEVKMELKKSTTLSLTFRHFSELTPAKLADIHRHLRSLIQSGHYHEVIAECNRVMELALKGLNYYQTYDRFFLGSSIFFGFIGWMTYILTLVMEDHSGVVRKKVKVDKLSQPYWRSDNVVMAVFLTVGVCIILLLFIQSLPWTNYLYCLIPVVLWMFVVLRVDILTEALQYILKVKGVLPVVSTACFLGMGLEILVLGFFYREMMSVGLVCIGVWPLIAKPAGLTQVRIYLWFFACLAVAVFPTLPVAMGFVDRRFVILGGVTVFLSATWYVIRDKETEVKSSRSSTFHFVQIVFVAIATYLSGYAVDHDISSIEQLISWSILGVSALMPLVGPADIMGRLLTIFLAFVSPFILLSISEILFIVCLCWLLYEWISLEYELDQTSTSASNGPDKSLRSQLCDLDFSGEDIIASQNSRKYLEMNDIRRAFFFAYLILTGFFGTGNIASINSFNPASVLCFLSVFSPFVMGALMLWKILIPCILITCTLRAVHVITRVPIRALFLLIFLMSDAMALHFFFLVRDYGSWLDIGTSISHYIIVMCMIIFIMLLFGFSHILTNGQVAVGKTVKRN